MSARWDDAARRRLAELADGLLPGGAGLPSASAVDVAGRGAARVFEARPDLDDALLEVVRASGDEDAAAHLERLQAQDPARWTVLTTGVAAAYYMNPEVRRCLGYAGQEGALIAAEDFYSWASAGLLDPVLERGPVHRPTPIPTPAPTTGGAT